MTHRIHTDFVCSFDPACPLKTAGNAETPCLTCRRWRRNSPQKRDRIHWVWGVKDRFTQFFSSQFLRGITQVFMCNLWSVEKKNYAQHLACMRCSAWWQIHHSTSQTFPSDMPSVGQCSKWFAASAAFLQWICPVWASWAALRNMLHTCLKSLSICCLLEAVRSVIKNAWLDQSSEIADAS